ncbi:sigma-70 family RNA polymerase sigma factor [Pseudoduganella eburnea]|uniref:Sigma-70 family RNA polymerase sigma factor n=1 Tax=Massilia eburnea TaxID=1776165 RepID=A0A6L6QPZ6_9BURK|nr:sigma-70 family RNA polymerase sigma factor [Massilia eburnea]MTW14290.1 sigma-70 family RNA polymerase sigma factor [Massilia eburnea]
MPQRRTQEQRMPVAGEATEAAEAALLASIAQGERPAFDQLYRQYFPRLARFLGRMARNPRLVEEVINDTMLVVWQKAASYNASCKVSTWVFAIAYRKALKALKWEDAPVEADFAQFGSEELAPEPLAERRELHEVVARALERLPMAHRIAVVLAFYHDMDYAEIAEVTGCPVNTVKTRMFHARRKLKELLADGWEGVS